MCVGGWGTESGNVGKRSEEQGARTGHGCPVNTMHATGEWQHCCACPANAVKHRCQDKQAGAGAEQDRLPRREKIDDEERVLLKSIVEGVDR